MLKGGQRGCLYQEGSRSRSSYDRDFLVAMGGAQTYKTISYSSVAQNGKGGWWGEMNEMNEMR